MSKWNSETLPNYFIGPGKDGNYTAYKEGVDDRNDWKEIMNKPIGVPISVKQIPDEVLATLKEKHGEHYQYYKVEKDGEIIGYKAIPLSKPASPKEDRNNNEGEDNNTQEGGTNAARNFARK